MDNMDEMDNMDFDGRRWTLMDNRTIGTFMSISVHCVHQSPFPSMLSIINFMIQD